MTWVKCFLKIFIWLIVVSSVIQNLKGFHTDSIFQMALLMDYVQVWMYEWNFTNFMVNVCVWYVSYGNVIIKCNFDTVVKSQKCRVIQKIKVCDKILENVTIQFFLLKFFSLHVAAFCRSFKLEISRRMFKLSSISS